MAKIIAKTFTVTRVSFKTVVVENGVPSFVDHTDAVFNGIQEREKVEKLLKARLGKDAMIVITNIESGQHRYVMSQEDFVLNAKVADDVTDGEDDGADEGDSQGDEQGASDAAGEEQEDPFNNNPAPVPSDVPEANVDIGL